MLSLETQTLKITPVGWGKGVSQYHNIQKVKQKQVSRLRKLTLISESDTPKSKLEMSSLPLASDPVFWMLLWTPAWSSNMSCCHLSGNSLGCEGHRKKKMKTALIKTLGKVRHFFGWIQSIELHFIAQVGKDHSPQTPLDTIEMQHPLATYRPSKQVREIQKPVRQRNCGRGILLSKDGITPK